MIFERLIYARVEPTINQLVPKEQAEFRRRKSTVDQVVLLTENIEDFCCRFVDLTAAYDSVWHLGLLTEISAT